MPGRLRLYVSSTMDDLAIERDLVVNKPEGFDSETVNTENSLARGERAWSRIAGAIRSCDLFVLSLGEH